MSTGKASSTRKAGYQLVPDEYRHAEHDHPGRSQAEHRGDQVDAGEHAGEGGQGHAHDPEVGAGAGGVDGLGQGGVGEPAPVGGAGGGQEARDQVMQPPRKSQYEKALKRGKAMSGAPICSGTR